MGIAGSTLAAVLGVTDIGATHAGCRHVGKRCHKSKQCCSGICKRKKCRAHDAGICQADQNSCNSTNTLFSCGADGVNDCYCFITTGEASFCGASRLTSNWCTRDEECEATDGAGAACVQCGSVGACVVPCPSPDQPK